MNEKEIIIQALKSCASKECSKCPYQGKGIACKYRLMLDAATMLEDAAATEKPKEAEQDNFERIAHSLALTADAYMTEAGSVGGLDPTRVAILNAKAAAVNECIELIDEAFGMHNPPDDGPGPQRLIEGGEDVYTVVWDNHEGNEQRRPVESLEDAKLEAADLAEKYGWAEILDAKGNPVEL